MEHEIVEKGELKFAGVKRRFNSDNSYEQIPKFWDEIMKTTEWDKGIIRGSYGICYEENGKEFSYMIGDDYNPQKSLPNGYEIVTFPKNLYVSFPCKGKIPESVQSVNTKIWTEWFPNSKEYKPKSNCCIEAYLRKDYVELWIPIEKI